MMANSVVTGARTVFSLDGDVPLSRSVPRSCQGVCTEVTMMNDSNCQDSFKATLNSNGCRIDVNRLRSSMSCKVRVRCSKRVCASSPSAPVMSSRVSDIS